MASKKAAFTKRPEVRHELSVVDNIICRGEQVVPPSSLRKRILTLAHQGHPGITRMQAALKAEYWWPGLRHDVERVVNECTTCHSVDKSAKVQQGPLQPVQYPDKPWSKLAIDIMGPFMTAPSNCRYIIVLVDYFSKWPEICFTTSISSSTIINFLAEVFAREGLPDEIVSDNGTQFTSSEFEAYLHVKGIKHIKSSLYYPQANGQVERVNRVLKGFIQCAIAEKKNLQTTVNEYISIYRTTPHTTTKKSPFYLLRGRIPRTRLSIVGFHAGRFHENPYQEWSQLRRNVDLQHARMKKDYDRRHAASNKVFQPQDTVRIRVPVNSKIKSRYSSPRRILRKVADNTYEMEDGTRWNASKLTRTHMQPVPQHVTEYYPFPIVEQTHSSATLEQQGLQPQPPTSYHIDEPTTSPTRSPSPSDRPHRTRRPPAYLQDYVVPIRRRKIPDRQSESD